MTRRVVDVHPQAVAEGREARNWYRSRSQVVEERFRLALRRAIEELRRAPDRWPSDSDDLRRCRVIGFPYRLIYWTDGEYVLVLAIAHAKRRPGYWRRRLANQR